MNHPDLYFPSHTPESTAQNKAMGKKLCSSFTSLAPVAPSNSVHCKLQRHPSRNPQSEQWKSGHGNTRKWKRGHGERKSTTSMRHTCIWWERQWSCHLHLLQWGTGDREGTGQGHGSETNLGFVSMQPYCQPGLGAELQRREEGLGNSMDIAQTSAWNKNILI